MTKKITKIEEQLIKNINEDEYKIKNFKKFKNIINIISEHYQSDKNKYKTLKIVYKNGKEITYYFNEPSIKLIKNKKHEILKINTDDVKEMYLINNLIMNNSDDSSDDSSNYDSDYTCGRPDNYYRDNEPTDYVDRLLWGWD